MGGIEGKSQDGESGLVPVLFYITPVLDGRQHYYLPWRGSHVYIGVSIMNFSECVMCM